MKLPESYQLYLSNAGRRESLELIFSQTNIPKELSWHQLTLFHKAKISYLVMVFQYFEFLNEIWSNTWGKALSKIVDKNETESKQLNYFSENDKDYYKKLHLENIFENGYLPRYIELIPGHLACFCSNFYGQLGASISFTGWSAKNDISWSNELKISNPIWKDYEIEIEHNISWYWRNSESIKAINGEINIHTLYEAAVAAVESIATYLNIS